MSLLSSSLKVIGTDTDRSATYDFLLVFHSKYMDLSSIVSKTNGDFCSKIANFPTPCI